MLQRAQQHYASGQRSQAKQLFMQLHQQWPSAAEPMEFLAMIALQSGQAPEAVGFFEKLVEAFPDNPLYCDRLGSLLARLGRGEDALARYRRLLDARPQQVVTRFNYAGLLRRQGDNEAALVAYERCLKDGIEGPEEVLANMGSILADLNRHAEAEQALTKALAINPGFCPARYNLALRYEEAGDWPAARREFERIPEKDPLYPQALARLAQGEKFTEADHPCLQQIHALLQSADLKPFQREELHFSLAQALDSCGRYPEALEHCKQANTLAAKRTAAYDRSRRESLVNSVIASDQASTWDDLTPVSEAPLVFICGMFRSGSTLLEQMLAAHPSLVSGGEIDFFRRKLPLTELLGELTRGRAEELGLAYVAHLDSLHGPGARVIDKRLDNSYYLGILLRLFPQAKFLRTLRNPLDNALSIYFQQLVSDYSYAHQLTDIGHYWLQQQRLMDYWTEQYPARIVQVHYEELVDQPRLALEPAVKSLGLDWSDDCLDFHNQRTRVRTASVAQVRQPLYTASAGRWHNYEQSLQPLRDYLQTAGVVLT